MVEKVVRVLGEKAEKVEASSMESAITAGNTVIVLPSAGPKIRKWNKLETVVKDKKRVEKENIKDGVKGEEEKALVVRGGKAVHTGSMYLQTTALTKAHRDGDRSRSCFLCRQERRITWR